MPPKSLNPLNTGSSKKKVIKIEDGFDDQKYFGFDVSTLRKIKVKANLGYLGINVVQPPNGAYWGKFNNRAVNEVWVDKLCDSFALNMDHCADENVMDVVLDPAWLENKHEIMSAVDGFNIYDKDVKMMKFNSVGQQAIKNNNLWMLSGNHRRLAVVKFVGQLKVLLRQEEDKLAAMKKGKSEEDLEKMDPDRKRELSAAEDKVAKLKNKIHWSSHWMVRIYDRAKIESEHEEAAKATYRFISKNQTLEAQRATDEELLQETIDEMKDALEEDLPHITDTTRHETFEIKYPLFMKKVGEKAEQFKNTSHGYRRICCVPAFALGLVMASRIQTHYTHAPWFKLKQQSEMIDVYGTFVSEFIVESIEYLERIANPEQPPMNIDEIEDKKMMYLQKLTSGQEKELRESLVGMEKAFKGTGDLSLWTPGLLEDIDKAFQKNYMDNDGEPVPCLFFPDSKENQNMFSVYCVDVEAALRKHAASAPPHARAYFVYYSIWQMRGWKFPMPLGTASVVGALDKMLKKVKNGFAEVIAWLATAVSWSPRLNMKNFLSRDQFDTMIDTVLKDPLINKNRATGMRRKLYTIFFSHLTTTITELEIYLMRIDKPRDDLPKDIAGFRKLADATLDVIVPPSKKKKVVAEMAKEREDANALYQNALAEWTAFETSTNLSESQKFIAKMHWTPSRFGYEWRSNIKLMDNKSYNHGVRTGQRLGERLLVMSGLTWNLDSKAKDRDWAPQVAAITLETAIVEHYREDLLDECRGTSRLRQEIKAYFDTFTLALFTDTALPSQGTTRDWQFVDKYRRSRPTVSTGDDTSTVAPTGEGTVTTQAIAASGSLEANYKPEAMRRSLNQVHPMLKKKAKGKVAKREERRNTSIEGLFQNKLLWCSDKRATPGTMETLAYHCIAALSNIIEFNTARLRHRDEMGKNSPFLPDNSLKLKRQTFEEREHMKTKEFSDFLGYDDWIFKSESDGDDLVMLPTRRSQRTANKGKSRARPSDTISIPESDLVIISDADGEHDDSMDVDDGETGVSMSEHQGETASEHVEEEDEMESDSHHPSKGSQPTEMMRPDEMADLVPPIQPTASTRQTKATGKSKVSQPTVTVGATDRVEGMERAQSSEVIQPLQPTVSVQPSQPPQPQPLRASQRAKSSQPAQVTKTSMPGSVDEHDNDPDHDTFEMTPSDAHMFQNVQTDTMEANNPAQDDESGNDKNKHEPKKRRNKPVQDEDADVDPAATETTAAAIATEAVVAAEGSSRSSKSKSKPQSQSQSQGQSQLPKTKATRSKKGAGAGSKQMATLSTSAAEKAM